MHCVSQGMVCTDSVACCHAETEFTGQTCYRIGHNILTPRQLVRTRTLHCQHQKRCPREYRFHVTKEEEEEEDAAAAAVAPATAAAAAADNDDNDYNDNDDDDE